jgi:hypothetical protein
LTRLKLRRGQQDRVPASVGEPPDRTAVGEETIDLGLVRHELDTPRQPAHPKIAQRQRRVNLAHLNGEDLGAGVPAP